MKAVESRQWSTSTLLEGLACMESTSPAAMVAVASREATSGEVDEATRAKIKARPQGSLCVYSILLQSLRCVPSAAVSVRKLKRGCFKFVYAKQLGGKGSAELHLPQNLPLHPPLLSLICRGNDFTVLSHRIEASFKQS